MGRPHPWPGAGAAVWPSGPARGTAGGTEPVAAELRPACEPDATKSASLGTAGLRKTPRVPPLQSSPVAVANLLFFFNEKKGSITIYFRG